MNDLCNIITNQRYDLVLKKKKKKDFQRFSFFQIFSLFSLFFLLQIIVGYFNTQNKKAEDTDCFLFILNED